MADPPVGPGTNATSWPERVAASAIPTVLGGAAFAVSFSNVRAVAVANGTGEWKSWALAASVELLALGAALEVRRRRARDEANVWPWLVLLVGIVATVAANLDTADAPGWGTVVAVWPALAYLLAASLKATRPAVHAVHDTVQTVHETVNTPPDESPVPHLVPALPEPEDELLHVARVLIADAAANGRPIARTRLGAKIREAGFQVGAQRALSLYDAVVAA